MAGDDPACVGLRFLGRLATIGFFMQLGIFAFKEFAKATGLYRDWWMTGAVYLGILGVGVLSAVNDPLLGTPGAGTACSPFGRCTSSPSFC